MYTRERQDEAEREAKLAAMLQQQTQQTKRDEERAGQIRAAYELLVRAIGVQEEVAATLDDRLQCALSANPPAGEHTRGNEASCPTCPLAAAINQQTARILQTTDHLRSLLRRIEL